MNNDCRIMSPPPEIFEQWVYRKQDICDQTLDDADLERRLPLDNGRHLNAPTETLQPVGQLDRLPPELLLQIMLRVDIPSLTTFRRVNRRAMELVDSVPQYAAVVKHCPNVIRAIVSLQAEAYDCDTLYRTLSTTQCATCTRFGDHLYLISCLRVCYFCFTRRREYLPLTIGQVSTTFKVAEVKRRKGSSTRQLLDRAKIPRILGLTGTYCNAGTRDGILIRKRFQLFDRQALKMAFPITDHVQSDRATREPRRYMSIITAPYLRDAGQQADWGYFCLGCRNMTETTEHLHFRNKYTREEILEHIAKFGPVNKTPGYHSFFHVAPT